MNVGLFVPCYVDQLAPQVGRATVSLLDELGISFVFPPEQTCCGQPFLTAGALPQARQLAQRFVEVFAGFDHVVTPSGSCAATMRNHLTELAPGAPDAQRLASQTYELCELLVDVIGVGPMEGRLEARVGMHHSCHALRGLRLGEASELLSSGRQDPARTLLGGIEGIQWVDPVRRDECCGFGGVFCVDEAAVSQRMGRDRVADHQGAGAEIITSTDVSCLAHMGRLARTDGSTVRFMHVAELLANRDRESP